jgi:hypothetical protein
LRLWRSLRQRRLHPLARITDNVAVRPAKRKRSVTPAYLVPRSGRSWIGAAAVFGAQLRRYYHKHRSEHRERMLYVERCVWIIEARIGNTR